MNLTVIRLQTLPGMLRKGDLVEDRLPTGGLRTYVLTRHPDHGMIPFHGKLIPVIYLHGMDNYAGREVHITKVARLALGSTRELPLIDGRKAPVFFRPPEPVTVY